MKFRRIFVVASVAIFVMTAPGVASAAHQKWSVVLSGDCKDLTMDEAKDDDDCAITATVSPKAPARTVTLQMKTGTSWTKVKSVRSKAGSVSFEISAYDEEDSWRDGTVRYRISVAKSGKEKVFTSKQLVIQFVPDSGEDSGDDEGQDDDSEEATPSKTTPSTKQPTATAPTMPGGHGGSPTATAPTTPGSPTNTLHGGDDSNWFAGVNSTSLGAFCMSADPTMYVGAEVCTGVTTRKSLSQFKQLIAGIPNSSPNFKRNGFCTQAMYAMGGLSVTQVNAKCAEANAGR